MDRAARLREISLGQRETLADAPSRGGDVRDSTGVSGNALLWPAVGSGAPSLEREQPSAVALAIRPIRTHRADQRREFVIFFARACLT